MDCKQVLLKQSPNKQELTNWENILITKNKDRIINFEIAPADHLTTKVILNPVESSRSELLQEVETKVSRSWVDNEETFLERNSHILKYVMYYVTNIFL